MGSETITALETIRPAQPQPSIGAYEPRNFEEAMRLASVFASSGLLGVELRNDAAALLVMATGAELGISATAALRSIYVVKGKPMMSADLMVGLCLRRRDVCEHFMCVESTEVQATYSTKRVGVAKAVTHTFTMTDAQKARLTGADGMYAKYPRTMLRHRAAAELARMVYPDLVLGLYSDAERDELEAIDVTPAKPQQLVTEPLAEAPAELSLDEAMKRWRGALFAAVTLAECDAVARHMGKDKRLIKDTPEHVAMTTAYKARKQELKTRHERPTTPPVESPPPTDAELVGDRDVAEREPGSDDA
jgi:hypothetical protein